MFWYLDVGYLDAMLMKKFSLNYSLFNWFLAFLINVFQSSVLALDESALDVDQVENLIKFCPTKEEMDLLKVSFYL